MDGLNRWLERVKCRPPSPQDHAPYSCWDQLPRSPWLNQQPVSRIQVRISAPRGAGSRCRPGGVWACLFQPVGRQRFLTHRPLLGLPSCSLVSSGRSDTCRLCEALDGLRPRTVSMPPLLGLQTAFCIEVTCSQGWTGAA